MRLIVRWPNVIVMEYPEGSKTVIQVDICEVKERFMERNDYDVIS